MDWVAKVLKFWIHLRNWVGSLKGSVIKLTKGRIGYRIKGEKVIYHGKNAKEPLKSS